MHINLSGQTALVTGSTEGIGQAIARGLAEAGADVIINGRKAETVDPAVRRLAGEFPKVKVRGVAADLSTAEGVKALVAQAPRADILVNNLGVYSFKGVLEEEDDMFVRMFELNLMSGLRLARAYLPAMLENNRGRIIFCGSNSGLIGSRGGAYGIAKLGQLHVARSVAELTRGTAVTVNTIMISATHTASADKLLHGMADEMKISFEEAEKLFMADFFPKALIGRVVRAEEVANLAVYLASPQASATNGAVLSAEGGARDSVFG
jgi:NAD(P)-dependent dehydrogenase (short-subunit alcohol dehydrogenase family)